MSRPLPNRVRPDGAIMATPARGTVFGNRGGRLHDAHQHIRRNWASKQWICCVLAFKNWQREVMGQGYTELFFLDEATALAAGHRPCFECRRQDALVFARIWAALGGATGRARAPEIDRVLHEERLGPKRHGVPGDLPPGAMFDAQGEIWLRVAGGARQWSFAGYGPICDLPRRAKILTPPTSCAVIAGGYEPGVHPSAEP